MSYLNLDDSPLVAFNKAIISFWVRIPGTTYKNIAAAAADDDGPFAGILPFITFGKAQSVAQAEATDTTLATTEEVTATGTDLGISYPFGDNVYTSTGDTFKLLPSYIGANVYSDGSGGNLIFGITLPGANGATGLRWTIGSIDVDSFMHCYTNNPGIPVPNQIKTGLSGPGAYTRMNVTYHWQDVTDIIFDSAQDNFTASTQVALAPDMWHHIFISFDVSGGCEAVGSDGVITQTYYALDPPLVTDPAIPEGVIPSSPAMSTGTLTSSCKVYAAVDDINHTGPTLVGSDYSSFGLSPNDWPTNFAVQTVSANSPGNGSGITGGEVVPGVSGINLVISNITYDTSSTPSYSYSGGGGGIDSSPIGLPAAGIFVDELFHVEMAEFQLFAGMAMDTNNLDLRRAFIDDNGLPVPPDQKANDGTNGQPALTSGSIEFLGQHPDILLHKSGNWIKGKNTGSTGMDYTQDPPQIIDSGQFTPIAHTTAYTPNPSLNGRQGDPQ